MDQPIRLSRPQMALLAAREASRNYKPIPLTHEQKALRAARKKADEICDRVSDSLRKHSCVAFAIICGDAVEWWPNLDIAVRLLSIAHHSSFIDDGRLIWGLRSNSVTPVAIERGYKAVADCAMLVKNCPLPYAFLGHSHGQTSIEYSYRCDPTESPLTSLADAIAQDVACISKW